MIKLTIEEQDIKFVTFKFPGGETQVRITDPHLNGEPAEIYADIHSSDDLITVLLLTDALRRLDHDQIHLTIPYLPYARQDRVCETGEAFSLGVLARLINAQEYDSVTVWDAHSDVAPAIIDNCINRHCDEFLGAIPASNCVYVAPDAGAHKKVIRAAIKYNKPCIQASKIRNTATGEITGVEIHGVLHHNNHYLIVDDICDGGRTFVELAKVLKESSAKVDLYVTHGIFSKGLGVFNGLIDTIYCANPWPETWKWNSEFVTLIKV